MGKRISEEDSHSFSPKVQWWRWWVKQCFKSISDSYCFYRTKEELSLHQSCQHPRSPVRRVTGSRLWVWKSHHRIARFQWRNICSWTSTSGYWTGTKKWSQALFSLAKSQYRSVSVFGWWKILHFYKDCDCYIHILCCCFSETPLRFVKITDIYGFQDAISSANNAYTKLFFKTECLNVAKRHNESPKKLKVDESGSTATNANDKVKTYSSI